MWQSWVWFLLPSRPYWHFPSAQSEKKWWAEFLPQLSSLPQLLPFSLHIDSNFTKSQYPYPFSVIIRNLTDDLTEHTLANNNSISPIQIAICLFKTSVSMFSYSFIIFFFFLPSCAHISYHSPLVESGAQHICFCSLILFAKNHKELRQAASNVSPLQPITLF